MWHSRIPAEEAIPQGSTARHSPPQPSEVFGWSGLTAFAIFDHWEALAALDEDRTEQVDWQRQCPSQQPGRRILLDFDRLERCPLSPAAPFPSFAPYGCHVRFAAPIEFQSLDSAGATPP